MYVELVERSVNNRGNIVPISKAGKMSRDYEAYTSLFPFDKNILPYVELHGTIKGYSGEHACLFLCIDIDNENDLEGSRHSTLQVIDRLNSIYNISPDELFIYYSGNKGFHVYLCDRLLGIHGRYFESIGSKCKNYIKDTFGGIANIDTVIYEDHRLIRIPNSKHAKTGRYKVEITLDELNLGIENIKEISMAPREANRKILYTDIQKSEKLFNDFLSYLSGTKATEYGAKDSDGFWGVMPAGNRNSGYHKQACSLFKNSTFSEPVVFDIISSLNKSSTEPLLVEEITSIVRSAAKVRVQVEQKFKLYTFQDAIPLWLDSIKPEKNRLTLVFEELEKEMRGKLRGKVCDIIGYGGSKKSLFAQFVALSNITSGQRVLYSTMEMSVANLMERTINMTLEPEQYSASLELEIIDKHDHEYVVRALEENASPILGDKLWMADAGSMTCDGYDEMIKEIVARTGMVDVLVVDGLGMMGGAGEETARYSQATKELKDLAKKWNMFVILICHISKGEDRECRDLSKAVRGSEKIIDNCDFYISMAQHKMTTEGMPDYNNKYGNIRLVNKRGSGKVIDIFYELDTRSLFFNKTEKSNIQSTDTGW